MKITILSIMVIILISISAGSAENNTDRDPITYKVIVDYKRFHKVYDTGSGLMIPYKNKTLNIYKGDTVIWSNDEDKRITIVNEQNLWNSNDAILGWSYKEFRYTFNESGKYDIYIKEYPKLQQKIVVGPIEEPPKNRTDSTVILPKKNDTITTVNTKINTSDTKNIINNTSIPKSRTMNTAIISEIMAMIIIGLIVIIMYQIKRDDEG